MVSNARCWCFMQILKMLGSSPKRIPVHPPNRPDTTCAPTAYATIQHISTERRSKGHCESRFDVPIRYTVYAKRDTVWSAPANYPPAAGNHTKTSTSASGFFYSTPPAFVLDTVCVFSLPLNIHNNKIPKWAHSAFRVHLLLFYLLPLSMRIHEPPSVECNRLPIFFLQIFDLKLSSCCFHFVQ